MLYSINIEFLCSTTACYVAVCHDILGGTLPCIFKVNKPGIQADRLLRLVKILAHSPFLESQTVHAP